MSHTDNSSVLDSLKRELYLRYALTPSDQWLTAFLPSVNRHPPLPALTSTAHFHLLSTDFTVSLSAQHPNLLPSNIGDIHVKSTMLQADVPVQILDVVDTGTSKYSQVEAIERVERGEEIRGREVIRHVPDASNDGNADAEDSRQDDRRGTSGMGLVSLNTRKCGTNGPHKLLLQDPAGTKVWAFELGKIDRITIVNTVPARIRETIQAQVDDTQIGCKLLLQKGTNVRRGLVMLTPSTTTVMGGKVAAWDQGWRAGRKIQMQQQLGTENDV